MTRVYRSCVVTLHTSAWCIPQGKGWRGGLDAGPPASGRHASRAGSILRFSVRKFDNLRTFAFALHGRRDALAYRLVRGSDGVGGKV